MIITSAVLKVVGANGRERKMKCSPKMLRFPAHVKKLLEIGAQRELTDDEVRLVVDNAVIEKLDLDGRPYPCVIETRKWKNQK